jgi:hypothetical protein
MLPGILERFSYVKNESQRIVFSDPLHVKCPASADGAIVVLLKPTAQTVISVKVLAKLVCVRFKIPTSQVAFTRSRQFVSPGRPYVLYFLCVSLCSGLVELTVDGLFRGYIRSN